MADKIMLLDGHSLLNRAFYGLPDLTNAEGKHTNAVLGFLNIMLRYVEEEKPTHLLVAFDRKEPTFRHIKYKEYKGTRKPMPAELHEQVPLMKKVLKTMEIPIITQAGIEADDILGTIGKEAEEAGFDVAIVSGDRDLLQLATKKVKIKIPKTKASGTVTEDYYEEDVRELYGVSPTEFIDMKCLWAILPTIFQEFLVSGKRQPQRLLKSTIPSRMPMSISKRLSLHVLKIICRNTTNRQ